jgi:DNA mismatch repair protein MutH
VAQGRLYDEPWKHDEGLLLERAEDTVGKRLVDLEAEIQKLDAASRVLTKAGAGYVIEYYFGIRKNSEDEPDFPELGIELKSVPLRERNGLFTVKEPLSLNMVNYMKEYKCDEIKQSSLYKKNRRVLFVCYLHSGPARSEYPIKYAFLWTMDDRVLDELRPDFDRIIKKIRAGHATDLHQRYDRWLTTCPKHNGDFKDPHEMTSKVKQPFSPEWAERKAYRLKTSYMSIIIGRHLGLGLLRNGRGSEPLWWKDIGSHGHA